MLTHLLDTNTVIYVIRRTPMEVRDRFIAHTGQLAISSIKVTAAIAPRCQTGAHYMRTASSGIAQ